MSETASDRLKRLKIRSWRRGMKEMDLILGPFADARLSAMSDADLVLYDRMLGENDQDLYAWVTGQRAPPAELAAMIEVVAGHAGVAPVRRGLSGSMADASGADISDILKPG